MRGAGVARGAPSGRDAAKDIEVLRQNSHLLDPYSSSYYGLPGSRLHYLYLGAVHDADSVNPLPPQNGPPPMWMTALLYVGIPVGLFVVLVFVGRSIAPRVQDRVLERRVGRGLTAARKR